MPSGLNTPGDLYFFSLDAAKFVRINKNSARWDGLQLSGLIKGAKSLYVSVKNVFSIISSRLIAYEPN